MFWCVGCAETSYRKENLGRLFPFEPSAFHRDNFESLICKKTAWNNKERSNNKRPITWLLIRILFDEEYTADCFCIFCLILSGRTDNGPSISDNSDGKIEQEAKKKLWHQNITI